MAVKLEDMGTRIRTGPGVEGWMYALSPAEEVRAVTDGGCDFAWPADMCEVVASPDEEALTLALVRRDAINVPEVDRFLARMELEPHRTGEVDD